MERSKFIISTKFGIELPSWRNDVAKDKVRGHCLAALGRLQMDYIDVFMVCRIPKDIITPIEETMKGLKALVEEGKIKAIGLNKPTADQIKRAHAVHPVACVEHEYSVFSRGIEDTILPLCKKLGIKVLCYSPVGGGMLKTKPADGEGWLQYMGRSICAPESWPARLAAARKGSRRARRR